MSAEETTAYINAGGKGTRLRELFAASPDADVAKALLAVGEPPVRLVDHHIARLLEAGVRNVIVGAGHQRAVAEYIDESYPRSSQVSAARTARQLGTAGELMAAYDAAPDRFGRRVLVCNVDTILDIDTADFHHFHGEIGRRAVSIALTRRNGVPNEGAFRVDTDHRVIYSAEAPSNTLSPAEADALTVWKGSSTGTVLIETDLLATFEPRNIPEGELSIYRQFLGTAMLGGHLAGYDNSTRFFIDIGTVRSWSATHGTGLLEPFLHRRVDNINGD